MPRIQTKCFGELEYSPDSLFEFPNGIPGFENERAFVFLERADAHPLLFMQSLSTPEVCLILLPVLSADRRYKLQLSDEDLSALGLPPGRPPRIGSDVLCAVPVCAADSQRPQSTVNLLAPILVNLKQRIGIQGIQSSSGYSHQHPLVCQEQQRELAACS
jgi:flagellar assembly factor FliW